MISRKQETWAIALLVEQRHGEDGPRYIAEQIGRLALDGDNDGVERWREIARCYDKLRQHEEAN